MYYNKAYAFGPQHTCPCTLTHLCQMYFPIPIKWMSLFPTLGLLGGIFHFIQIFKETSLTKQ